ncbi:putative nicotinate-nucleotide adenylyltransferase [Oceaniferula spumae]|uniref:Probable nicotinate-nucleotide adenylyltransferase n=1 Tax=Oceaniferula spumae TaxID=2979115 RepID=A0AAT9FGF2_9BACT
MYASSPDNHAQPRICLFGGTFDPIHLGHSHIAAAAIRELTLDRLIFLPCRQSPHKTGKKHASSEHRLEMCRLATANLQHAEVDDFDLTAPEPCYSWRTVEHMRNRFPDARFFWLMGTDQWLALPRWNRVDHLASMVEFIVFTRGEKPAPREGYRMHSLSGDHPASATQLRQAVADQDLSLLDQWLHPDVLKYIQKNHLYLPDSPEKRNNQAGS